MTTDALIPTYARLPVHFTEGKGAWLTDTDGNRYLDAMSGIGVCGLGHCHPAITQAITEQAARLVHTSNLYHIDKQTELAQRLRNLSGMERVFFSNSGAEANEAAIKLARLHGHKKGIEVPTIIVMENSFHGRTLATLSATGNRKVQAGFEPLIRGLTRAPYDDVDAIKTIAKNNPSIAAILVEPIQGEGGLNIPANNYLNALKEICEEHDWLLMLDEVQTGNGRTGKYFSYQHNGILPDVVTTAKGLGNGFPIGACLVAGKASELFQPGTHGSTYGGNPLGCATALAVLTTLEKDGLIQRASELGKRIADGLSDRLAELENVTEVRNKGLMIGIELAIPCGELVQQALSKGLLINVTAGNVVRLLPPLVLSNTEADEIIQKLSTLISTFLLKQ
jgi:acetylornithine aminotransferase